MSDVLVFGSSHIKRLKQYITLNRIKNYGLQQFNSVTCGIPGGNISNLQHIGELEQLLQTYTPRFLAIHIGGNDLDQVDFKASDIELIVLRCVHIMNLFAQLYSVKIAVCQLMFRDNIRFVDVSDYNRYVIEANKRLKQELQGNANVIYWNLKGLKENFTQNLGDGAHLNWNLGYPKFYRNIREVILFLSRL